MVVRVRARENRTATAMTTALGAAVIDDQQIWICAQLLVKRFRDATIEAAQGAEQLLAALEKGGNLVSYHSCYENANP